MWSAAQSTWIECSLTFPEPMMPSMWGTTWTMEWILRKEAFQRIADSKRTWMKLRCFFQGTKVAGHLQWPKSRLPCLQSFHGGTWREANPIWTHTACTQWWPTKTGLLPQVIVLNHDESIYSPGASCGSSGRTKPWKEVYQLHYIYKLYDGDQLQNAIRHLLPRTSLRHNNYCLHKTS